MKYTKINYWTIGRYPAGARLGIVTKMEAEGYAVEGIPGIAVKRGAGNAWYIDHVDTGLAIVTVGSKSREAAVKEYVDHYQAKVDAIKPEMMKDLICKLVNAVPEEEAATYVMETYTTTYDHRYEVAEKAAKKAGLIVRRATDESYQRGGKMILIGKAEAVKGVLNMMKEKEEKAAATMAEIEAKAATEEATATEATATEATEEPTAKEEPEKIEAAATVEPAKDPEEVKADVMSEIEAGNFAVLLPMFAMRRDNAAAIMAAGIEAGAYSLADIKAYLTRGIMPAFHTFNEWKACGYIVNKGEKAAFKAYIWKHIDATEEPEEATEEAANEGKEAAPDFIRKVAFFFSIDQVTKKERKELNADGVTIETRGKYEIATGDTRAHKEELKAAGFTWNHKRGEWFRLAATATAGDGAKAPAPAVKVAAAAVKAETTKEKEAVTSATSAPIADIKRVFNEAVKRIKAADLTDAQRNKLILEAGDKKIFAEAIAHMLETVAAAEGKVYDVNGKAALIGGKIREDWRGDKSAYAEGEFWRAYVSERYSWKEIRICMKGNGTKETCVRIELKTEEGKKPRIDATKTAENMRSSLTARLEEIEKIGTFAGNVKALEEKKAAVLAMIEDIKKSANAGLDTVRDFGLYAGYRTFEAARV